MCIRDRDAYLDDIVALLLQADPDLQDPADPNYYFKSVIVTDCHGEDSYYQMETDTNGEAQDTVLADGQFGDADGLFDENTDVAGHIDASYTLSFSGDQFILA